MDHTHKEQRLRRYDDETIFLLSTTSGGVGWGGGFVSSERLGFNVLRDPATFF